MNTIRLDAGKRVSGLLAALVLGAALAACGGGGGNPGAVSGGSGSGSTGGSSGTGGTGGSTTPVPVAAPGVTLAFLNAAGTPSNSLSSAAPLTASATVKDKDGKPVANALVAFATDNALAVFSPSAGTSLTDASGVATVSMRPASLSAGGAGKVTATTTVAGTTVVSEANFSVGATALALGTLTLAPASIDAYGSTVLAVDVLANGARYTDQQLSVHFSSACVTAGKATLATTVPTNNGSAQTVYRDQGCGSNDVITASVDGVSKSAMAALAIAPPAAASVQFTSALPVDQSIVIRGQGGIGRSETATLKFKVFDTFSHPLPGQVVSFSTTSPYVTVNKKSDSTDQNGEVITTVNSGDVATTFRVVATLPSGVSTISDSIVVTTGIPVQRAFSLGVGTPNVEALTTDSTPTTPATSVSVLLADQFGNPVADGTPVVFQTNMGAIGTSSKGGCNTVNGGCSVDFRAQNPRSATPGVPATACNNPTNGTPDSTRPGVATICASTTDGTNAVFAKINIIFSGSTAANVFLDGSATRLQGGVTKDLGSVGAKDSKVFRLQIGDVNMNPMPAGTKVEITEISNGTAVGVAPPTVQKIFDVLPNDPLSNQGTFHTVTIGSSQPDDCKVALTSTFNVTVTTPGLLATSYPFKVTFTCP